MTDVTYQVTCGVMFRVNGNDSHAHPAVVSDFNLYAALGGLTHLYSPERSNLVRGSGEFVISLNQLQDLDILLEESPWVKSYSLWLGEVEGVETTVIDIVLVDGIDFETGMSEHARFLPLCHEIVSNATVLAAPDGYFREPPIRAL